MRCPALNRLHQESGEPQLRPGPFWKYQKWPQSVGGNGASPGGAHDNSNESPQMSLRAKRHDRTGRPVVCRLWTTPQTCDFQDFFCCSLFCCNWFVYS